MLKKKFIVNMELVLGISTHWHNFDVSPKVAQMFVILLYSYFVENTKYFADWRNRWVYLNVNLKIG